MKTALSTWGLSFEGWPCPGALQHPPEGQCLSLPTLELIVRDLLLSQDHAAVPSQQQSHAQQENLHGVASLESGVLETTAKVSWQTLGSFQVFCTLPQLPERGSGVGLEHVALICLLIWHLCDLLLKNRGT